MFSSNLVQLEFSYVSSLSLVVGFDTRGFGFGVGFGSGFDVGLVLMSAWDWFWCRRGISFGFVVGLI